MNYLQRKKLAFMSIVNQVKGFVRNVVGIPPLMLPNAVGEKLIDYKVYGESKQNGTPSPDAPVEIESVGEKTVNLFDKDNANLVNGYPGATVFQANLPMGSVYIPCKANTTYTISKTKGSRFRVAYYAEIPAHNISTLLVKNNDSATQTSTTSPTDAQYLLVYLYHKTYDTEYTIEEILDTLQIQEGSTATAYEPYGYKIPVKTIGKNFYDAETHFNILCESETMQGYEPSKGVVDGVECYQYWGRNFSKQSNYAVSKIGKGMFKENTQYTISFDIYDIFYLNPTTGTLLNGLNIQVVYIDGSYIQINPGARGKEKEWYHRSYTTTADKTVRYISISYSTGAAQTYLANFQVEEGTLETEYEPYKDLGTTNIYLDEPLRKVDKYADYVDFKNGCVVRELAIKTFNGTEGWATNNNDCVYLGALTDMAGLANCLSTHLPNETTAESGTLYFRPVPSVVRVYKKNDKYTDVEGWKVFLSEEYAKGTPVQLITAYITPKQEPIELPKIPTAKCTTTLVADTTVQPSNMEVTYYSSI